MKYQVICLESPTDDWLCMYETDAEPPRKGESFSLRFVSREKFTDTYIVKNILYQPYNSETTKIVLTLVKKSKTKAKPAKA